MLDKDWRYDTLEILDCTTIIYSAGSLHENIQTSAIGSSRYRNLLSYYASLPCWYYVVSALKYNPEKQKSDSFKRQYLRACNVLESMGISKIMSNAMLTALREGVFFGVIWGGDGNNFILQKLDPDYCNIVSVGDGGVFNFTYDMSQVKEEEICTYYPEDFRAIWSEYQTSGEKNQLVPQEISFCLKADPTVPEYSVPPFASVLPTLFAIRTIIKTTKTISATRRIAISMLFKSKSIVIILFSFSLIEIVYLSLFVSLIYSFYELSVPAVRSMNCYLRQ